MNLLRKCDIGTSFLKIAHFEELITARALIRDQDSFDILVESEESMIFATCVLILAMRVPKNVPQTHLTFILNPRSTNWPL